MFELCGKFGLNNINAYFQNNNHAGESVVWQEWTYKIGDKNLFDDTKRFSVLYDNLKGEIRFQERAGKNSLYH